MLITHIVHSTDAVFRYLLVRYGFHPTQASGLKEPLKVGDVMYVDRILVIVAHLLMLNKTASCPFILSELMLQKGFKGPIKWYGTGQ